MSNKIYYVYAYLYPDTGLPFYIGKGKNYRYKHHLKSRKLPSKNKHLYYTIEKIRSELLKDPIIVFVNTDLSESEAHHLEKILISIIGRSDKNLGPLCNLTDGGEGSSGHIFSHQTLNIMSKASLGRKHTKETKEKMRESHKGKSIPPHVREAGIKAISKTFTIVSPFGETIVITNLSKFAKSNGYSVANLHKVTTGQLKSAYGFTKSFDTENRVRSNDRLQLISDRF